MKSPYLSTVFILFVMVNFFHFWSDLQQTTIVCLFKIVNTEHYPSVLYCFEKVE